MKNILIIIILLFSCSDRKIYNVLGTIIEIKYNRNEFIIHHDEIPGFMMKMTMPFLLSDSTDINKYQIGDSLSFNLIIENDKALANNFKLLGKGTLPIQDDFFDDQYSPLSVGEYFSDITLLDVDSNNIALSSSDGKFRFISFIFSRCPVPNMCPAVLVKNQYLSNAFINNSNIEFILVSFDYIHDTPSILKKKYSTLYESSQNLKIYSSAGYKNDIFTLAGQSHVSFWGVDENDIGHTLRSVLIDPERRLTSYFEGTDWDPKIIEGKLKNILKAYNM